ncbi:beta-ketoacyl synthase N-terminal-like domain-containing protein [Novipirellula artificiosorum]|uniref:3-oxoacyl-(Acyl carrier protein) synthase n=1 Tax=Novipirellula artificiosorum TaxID=2528016 RepID=A0A5C6DWM6_9BACT|nr:beta-ketoacyl synthase N-terminal-like domain-containing protein [Novipirellula artificiosorum]TWU40594.1 3-oxoacyl-(acyl carrier protein) synthase [Novipirellula artificiosorum]
MSDRIVIADVEVISPIGFTGAETAASAAARIARLQESGVLDPSGKAITVASVPEEGLPDLREDPVLQSFATMPSRLIRLADRPLRSLAERLQEKRAAASSLAPDPAAFFLALPEPQLAGDVDSAMLLEGLGRQLHDAEPSPSARPLGIAIATGQTIAEGRSAGIAACIAAASAVANGKATFAIAGGVDSQLGIERLFELCKQNRVRSDRQPDGLTPGEGAGFVLLTHHSTCQQLGYEPLAVFGGGAQGFEPGHFGSDDPYLGDGLAQTITATLESAKDRPPIGCVYSSFNGERYWARELGVSIIRNQDSFAQDHLMEHPAECFGDLGAAHGAVMVALAALAIGSGKCSTPTLVYGSSDFGSRASVVIQSLP